MFQILFKFSKIFKFFQLFRFSANFSSLAPSKRRLPNAWNPKRSIFAVRFPFVLPVKFSQRKLITPLAFWYLKKRSFCIKKRHMQAGRFIASDKKVAHFFFFAQLKERKCVLEECTPRHGASTAAVAVLGAMLRRAKSLQLSHSRRVVRLLKCFLPV